jgi:hypothetical protein
MKLMDIFRELEGTYDCSPFLQRLGLLPIRPRQNSRIPEFCQLHSQNEPVSYPTQGALASPDGRNPFSIDGVSQQFPYSEKEIAENSNEIRILKK